MKTKRNKEGVIILENIKDRFNYTIMFPVSIILTILITVTFLWIPYWIIKGKNIYKIMEEL